VEQYESADDKPAGGTTTPLAQEQHMYDGMCTHCDPSDDPLMLCLSESRRLAPREEAGGKNNGELDYNK
jgi:hypothetical protein